MTFDRISLSIKPTKPFILQDFVLEYNKKFNTQGRTLGEICTLHSKFKKENISYFLDKMIDIGIFY